jgi:nicotinamidase-related amidase
VDLSSAVLFVVDVQNGFCNEISAPAVRRIVPLVRRWSDAGLPMIFTRYHNYPGSKFERLLDWTEVQHAPDTDLVDGLIPLADRAVAVADKTGYSVFTAEVTKIVDEYGWTDLVFCGLDTDTCVLKSVADAFEREHTPWLIRDACASHGSRSQHRTGVTLAGRFIGQRQLITHRQVAAARAAAPAHDRRISHDQRP